MTLYEGSGRMRNHERLPWSLKCRKSVERITKGDMLILVGVELARLQAGRTQIQWELTTLEPRGYWGVLRGVIGIYQAMRSLLRVKICLGGSVAVGNGHACYLDGPCSVGADTRAWIGGFVLVQVRGCQKQNIKDKKDGLMWERGQQPWDNFWGLYERAYKFI